ncbi:MULTISPECIES: DNA/RNA nuclease SfsA [unclassified Cobetia]|uniref:DNA/RNA nuclease SfsA n=1 Tax=unclassified Cobetia TaxID=2609414 RepID=UPI00178C94AE|nr:MULTISPECIES: DNA/RNA nuclease SfsA [unclassified Cobetia]MBE2169598.1 DNA/RNA nuclease SfsA [Cobetia sp. 2AS1]MDH2448406.1 DNA/RNA nuclease SfsA [Cobetia sp. 2AS]
MVLEGLYRGRLIRRYKRFFAEVELLEGERAGEVVTAHCPNTGSMRAVCVEGCEVWLSPSDNPKRKLAWTWELIRLPLDPPGADGRREALVAVHTGRANAHVEAALQQASVSVLHDMGLADFARLKRESRVEVLLPGNDTPERSRLDFQMWPKEEGAASIYLEVKQLTLRESDGHGYFPDSVSTRAQRHLASLAALVAAGHRCVLVFCVAHDGIEDVAPAAHLDPAYAQAFARAQAAGVEVVALGMQITLEESLSDAGQPLWRARLGLTRALPLHEARFAG